MKKINLKNQMITVTVVIIILSFVIIFLVIIPVIKNIIEERPSLLKGKDYYIFSFNTEGNYIDLMKYLKEIEELPYYFSINSLQLSQKNQLSPTILKFDAILFILDHEK